MIEKLNKLRSGLFKGLKQAQAELYFAKADAMFRKGLHDGSIIPFDENFYQQMSHTYIDCLPVSLTMKYLRPIIGPGKCYDRSLYMFLCFDDALLVRGDLKNLELRYGKENAGHGWIEMGDYACDPTYLMKFQKDLYYKLFGVSDVTKCSKAEYVKDAESKKLYEQVKNTTLADYQPKGRKRLDLLTMVPLVKGIAEMSNNAEFQKELADYLTSISYDEEQVYDLLREREKTLLESEPDKLM